MRRALCIVAALTALTATGSVTAFAGTAKPVKNGNYCINCTTKLSAGSFHVGTNGKRIDHWIYYNKCNPVPVAKVPPIPITNGSFSYKGTLTNVAKKQITFTISGTFSSAHLITGTIRGTGGGKTCAAVPMKAKFTGTGSFQP